jgi:hypothetical protein
MKKLVLATLLVASAVAVFLFQRGGDRDTEAAAREGPSVQPVADGRQAEEILESAPAIREPIAPPAPKQPDSPALPAVAPEPEVARPAPSASGPLSLSGTITVVDETGLEHPGENGSFMLVAFGEGNEGRGVDVEVLGGTWSHSFVGLEVAGPVRAIRVHDLRLGGRVAVLQQGRGETMKVPAQGFLDLRARWLSSIVLHVQDRENGRELPAVQLVESEEDWPANRLSHPGLAEMRSLGIGTSPIAIEPGEEFRWRRVFHARSPGYAWERIEIDSSRPEERFLLLDPGGDLGVALTGSAREPNAVLRLRTSARAGRQRARFPELVFEAQLGERVAVEIESLRAAAYQIGVEVGESWKDPVVLGKAEVDVVAGQRVDVVLAVEALEPIAGVPLEGTLVLPVEWEIDEPSLAFELLDPPLGNQRTHFYVDAASMTRVEGSPDTFRWSAGDVQPGRYEIRLYEPPFSISLAIGPTGERDARVVVPPPCDVLIRCVDDESGADVEVDDLHWNCRRPQWVSGGTLSSARFDDALSCWCFRAPAGEIEFQARDHRYEHNQESGTVGSGTNEFVLRLRPVTGVLLVLRDGGAEIGWNDEWSAKLGPVAGTSHGWSKSRLDSRLLIGLMRVKHRDSYRLTVGEIPGYEPVPEETIEIERGKVVEHVIELRRRR